MANSAGNMAAALPTSAARTFWSQISEVSRQAISQQRPWSELFDRSSFAKPESMNDATARIRKNWTYFRTNYIIFLLAVICFSLVMHPGSLFILGVLLGAWIFLYIYRTEQLVLFNRAFSEREVFVIMTVLTIMTIFLTSVGSLVISGLVVGLLLVAVHGALKVPDDLFLDEPESSAGFLSFLRGNNPPQVVNHV